MNKSDLEMMVGSNENILWRGKPNKKCFILECIFNPMLIFALIWGGIDLGFIGASVWASSQEGAGSMLWFIIPFFALHMMPVWIYLGGIITCVLKYKHVEYIVTDKGIYISGGLFTFNYEMKPFTDLSHINIHRGIFDQMLGVGDVIMECGHTAVVSGRHSHNHRFEMCDLEEYQRVFQLVKDLQTDIYSDTMYPNDMRPEANHGYRTQYVGNENSTVNTQDWPSFDNNRIE